MNCLCLLTHCYRTGGRIHLLEHDSNAFRMRRDVQNVMDASLYDRSPVRCVIKPPIMQELLHSATVLHEGTQERCAITQSEFGVGDVVLALPCGHVFLKDAIQRWLETESAECPVCRQLPSCEIMTKK